jgi:monoamine oxidase
VNWQPIETAPKDCWILVARGSEQGVVRWIQDHWTLGAMCSFVKPTHWQPLPEPPADAKERK